MRRFPDWMRRRIPEGGALQTEEILRRTRINTICESARCPNRIECYSQKTATFLILGNLCTRRCTFCSVPQGFPQEVDYDEARRVAQAALDLGLNYVVVTSVTRDDLPDGGAQQFQDTVLALRRVIPGVEIEVLTPDFQGSRQAIEKVCESRPTVFNHNLETIPRLYRRVRPRAIYGRSLSLLQQVDRNYPEIVTKSGLMVGLGESSDEVLEVLRDLSEAGCDILTVGQYLKPADRKLEAVEYVHPELFAFYRQKAMELGFKEAYAGPYVRSSYHAREGFMNMKNK